MFTITRLLAAILLCLLMLWALGVYAQFLETPQNASKATLMVGLVSFFVGWRFLGGPRRALWYSCYLGLQAVALAAIIASLIAAVRMVFVLGYRRQFTEPVEAVIAIPQITLENLMIALERDFIIQLVIGGLVVGMIVHVADMLLTRRRLAR